MGSLLLECPQTEGKFFSPALVPFLQVFDLVVREAKSYHPLQLAPTEVVVLAFLAAA